MTKKHHNCVTFITGACGNVGSDTLKHLCTTHPDTHVVGGVHDFELSLETTKAWNMEQVRVDGTKTDDFRQHLKVCFFLLVFPSCFESQLSHDLRFLL